MHDRIENADNAVWQLVLLLREIVEFVCAPSLSESQIANMTVLIEEYVDMGKELFPHANLRPKHHYADLSLQFGPLIHTWTMRKRCIRSSKNFRNVPKSLADRSVVSGLSESGKCVQPPGSGFALH